MYKKNSDYNFYQKENAVSIQYSDGSETENRLYDILCSVNDKSVWSEELRRNISDWPTEYHFSRRRHCLLRILDIKPGDRILELGCGCGAMTRYLGECGAIVDSVEGTISRARIAGERCKDLPNVKIHVDNFLEFTSTEKYDWVLFIGVLEYAPLFSDELDPIASYLNLASHYLKEQGQLVVAIENKLGLKYFNGCGEDHLNDINLSIENRYKAKSPVTFGKVELCTILKNNGFTVSDFYYPFPDYKIPSFIITEQGFNNPLFDSGELLKACASRDYTGKTGRVFEESLVWPELTKNGIAADLANSFLLTATRSADISEIFPQTALIASCFNTERLQQYVTETRFTHHDNKIVVNKQKLVVNDNSDLPVLMELKQDYCPGKSLQSELEDEWNKYNDPDVFVIFYKKWLEVVLSVMDGSDTLSEQYIDLVPFNIKMNKDEAVFIFDQEWRVAQRIDFNWIVCRGVYWSLVNLKTVHPLKIEPLEVINDLLSSYNKKITTEILNDVMEKERNFVKDISGDDIVFHSVVHKQPERVVNLHYLQLDILSQYRNKLASVENELAETISQRDVVENELSDIKSSRINRLAIRIARKIRSYTK